MEATDFVVVNLASSRSLGHSEQGSHLTLKHPSCLSLTGLRVSSEVTPKWSVIRRKADLSQTLSVATFHCRRLSDRGRAQVFSPF